MKKLITFLAFSAICFAQATITITDIDTTGFALPITVMPVVYPNLITFIRAVPPTGAWPNTSGIPLNTTLAADIVDTGGSCAGVIGASVGSKCSTVALTSAANLAQCNGLLIDSEVMLIYSVNAVANTAVVTRQMLGTSPVPHAKGQEVSITRVGDGTCAFKAMIADAISTIIQTRQADTTSAAAAASAAADMGKLKITAQGAIR